jgi:hypothetical protein
MKLKQKLNVIQPAFHTIKGLSTPTLEMRKELRTIFIIRNAVLPHRDTAVVGGVVQIQPKTLTFLNTL